MLKNKFLYITVWAWGLLFLANYQTSAQGTVKNNTTVAGDPVKKSVAGNDNAVSDDSTRQLIYPFDDEGAFQYPDEIGNEPLYLSPPSNIERKLEYDPLTKQYVMYEKIGDMYYRLPKSMGLKDYIKYDFDESIKNYWRTRRGTEQLATGENSSSLIPQFKIESEAFQNIFGSDVIDIKPQGYVEVSFGLQSNFNGNPSLPERQRRNTNFDFNDQINLSVTGKIGDKVDMTVNYNTEATFDFENKMKLEYNGKEDEILKKIEAGNVSLPLNGSLIQGGTNLFGIKTEMQFGKLNLTTIVSQNKGESQVIETEGGAQKTKFNISALDYDENRHFFLSKYFRDHYNQALSMLPTINSQVVINKVEVWVTNKTQNFTDSRDIIAFVDIGEQASGISNKISEFGAIIGQTYPSNTVPHNGANSLYNQIIANYSGVRESKSITKTMQPLVARGFTNDVYWQKIDQSRKLSSTEYTVNKQLGFISLNSPLNNDEVLAVAFNFTIGDSTYQVGEFSTDSENSTQTLILKLLKGTQISPSMPTWNYMMKNVYNLGAYDLSSTDFDFNVTYKDEATNTYLTSIPAGDIKDVPLLRVMNLDNLNSQNDYTEKGDGAYDFIEGVTVISQSGRVIFPILEPFGANVAGKLTTQDDKDKYAFTSLYTKSKVEAEQDDNHNKFYLIGSYKGSSSSEISLNSFNLAQGSVVVYAGSQKLIENIDYTVDYALGKVKIINQSLIDSGTPIKVSTESQDLISMQRKTMMGTYASFAASDKLNIGGTLLFMNERPITNKVDLGEEPVSNLMLGLDFQYHDKSKFLTDMVNLLPFYNSKTESSISVEGEVAKLFTGQSKSTGNNVYIDDFEAVETSKSISYPSGWKLASLPQEQTDLFPEGDSKYVDNLVTGYNRARIAWYLIDRSFYSLTGSTVPAHIKGDLNMLSNHYMRSVSYNEIFPGKEIVVGASATYQSVFDVAFFPKERGPYNYDAEPVAGLSKGVDSNGELNDPQSRWGGIMRSIESPNFESSNVEYIEFWLLDPFIYNRETSKGGDLYFDLGNVSEDVLRDGQKAFENGLPESDNVTDVDTTVWGRVSTQQLLKQAFTSSDADSRNHQDVGLDGLRDSDERSFFQQYLDKLKSILTVDAYNKVTADPSSDNFHYYKGTDYDEEKLNIIDRYKKYNGMEGNTPVNKTEYEMSNSAEPDIEDLNKDNTLSETESYYQYHVSIRPEDMVVGKNDITDKITTSVSLRNSSKESVTWYQFKIPIKDYDKAINGINGFKSIRFIRMFLTGFADSVILRFGTLNFVSSDWREETKNINDDGTIGSSSTTFDMTSINIEENASRKPINYVLPPGIAREIDPTSNSTAVQMNEQSMLLRVKDLAPGDMKAVYKSMTLDMRQYENLKMAVHAEAIEGSSLNDYEVSLVVRLGSDYDNYYEYEIPLKLTPVPATSYNGDSNSDRLLVWPDENQLNIDLSVFTDLKMNRDASGFKKTDLYEDIDATSVNGKNIIRIKGNPSLGDVEKMHISIKNPKNKNKEPKSVEVWVNELRMSNVSNKGGWASNGRASVRLADLGNISLSGRTESVGWGSIDQVASQRNLEDIYQYDLAANIELGKLFPEKAGVHIPVFYSYSKSLSNPEYDPLSTDIKMSDALAVIESPEERDYLKSISQDVTTRESFTVNNVTIEPQRKKADRKPLPTDIENFSVSYSYTNQQAHNVDVEQQVSKVIKASLDYNYTISSKPVEPFKKIKFLDNDVLRLIKDFNFSYLPELISFRTDMSKEYYQSQARDNTGLGLDLPVTIQKNFLWNRNFDLRYNLTRNLKIDFTNQNVNRIDEMDGIEDRNLYPELYKEIQQELWNNLKSFGRPVSYQHSVDVHYTVPVNKLPLLDFTSASVTYKGNYQWLAGPILDESVYKIDVGNTVRNGMNVNALAQLNMITLYNKVPYFKNLEQKFRTTTRRYGSRNKPTATKPDAKPSGKTKEVKFEEKNVNFKANIPKSIFHKLGTQKVNMTVLSSTGDTIKGTISVVNDNRINFKTDKNYNNAQVNITGTIENIEPFAKKALDATTRFLLGVRSIRASYTRSGGTEMPGFLGQPQAFHFGSQDFTADGASKSSLAPGIPFLLGWQSENFPKMAAENGWISKDTTITKQYFGQSSETWNFGIQLEPIPNVKIDISGTRRESKNNSCFVQYNNSENAFDLYSKKESGNFDMTIFTLKTAFKEGINNDTLKTSALFDQFRKTNIPIIKKRLNEQRGYVDGVGYMKSPYGDTIESISDKSPDVIIPAFLAAYTGSDARKIPLRARPGLASIRPNWRINYNGNPQSISWMKDIFTSFNITHSYKSTYSIGSYETNLNYKTDESGFSWIKNSDGKFISQLDMNSISIQEDFSPLINIDVGFVNDLSASFEIRRSRALNFSFSNMQLSEMIKNEYTVGIGYRFTGLDMIIRTKKKSEKVSNDVNLRLDLSSDDYTTTFRKLDDDNGVLQSGTQLFSIDFQADYMVSDKLTIKLYYNYKFQNPHLSGGSEGFLQKDTKFGLSFNYSIM